jgi:hypothetical protein
MELIVLSFVGSMALLFGYAVMVVSDQVRSKWQTDSL